MLGNIGTTEIILILIILLIIFGSKGLTDIARWLGEVIREFKKTLGEKED